MTPEDGSQPDTAKAAPGWYPDPEHEDQERYWHGDYWTEERRPRQDRLGRPLTPKPERPNELSRGIRRVRGHLEDTVALQKMAPVDRSKAKEERKRQRAEQEAAEQAEREALLEKHRAEQAAIERHNTKTYHAHGTL